VLIPETYVADLNIRLSLYRRVGELVDLEEIEGFAAEMIDRFGKLPGEVENLLDVVAIKRWCRQAGVDRLDAGPKGAVLSFRGNVFARPDRLVVYISGQAGLMKLKPDHKLVYTRVWDDPAVRGTGVKRLMNDLARLATEDGPAPRADMSAAPPPPPPPPPKPARRPVGRNTFTGGGRFGRR